MVPFQWLESIIDRIMAVENGFSVDRRPNHVLVNEYVPGQGIMVLFRRPPNRSFSRTPMEMHSIR